MKPVRTFHYVGFARIADFLRCGWIIAKPNCSTMYTDLYGVTMEWLCDCRIPNTRTAST
jgi:hypothetical protein